MAKQTVLFIIGGERVEVEELTWDVIEDVVMPILDAAQARIVALRALSNQLTMSGMAEADVTTHIESSTVPWYKVRADDIRILAAAMRQPYEDVRRRLSLDESREVSAKMVELLRISGFTMPGEAEAASGLMETSTDSSPDSSMTDLPA